MCWLERLFFFSERVGWLCTVYPPLCFLVSFASRIPLSASARALFIVWILQCGKFSFRALFFGGVGGGAWIMHYEENVLCFS